MAQPLAEHWKALKQILQYSKGTIHHGLLMQPTCTRCPYSHHHAYYDANWASDIRDNRCPMEP